MDRKMMIAVSAVMLATVAMAVVVGSAPADSDATVYGTDVQPYAGIDATYDDLEDGATYYIVKGGHVSISFAGIEAEGMETDLAGSGLVTDYVDERIYGNLEKSVGLTIGEKKIRLEMSDCESTPLPVYGANYTNRDMGSLDDAYIGAPYNVDVDIGWKTFAYSTSQILDTSCDETYSLKVTKSTKSVDGADHLFITIAGTPTKSTSDYEVKCYVTTVSSFLTTYSQIYTCYIYHINIVGELTFKFDAGDGTVIGDSEKKVKYGSSVTLPGAEMTGCNFKGWYTQEGGLGEYKGKKGTIVDTGSFSLSEYTGGVITLYADWEVAKSVTAIEIDSKITMKVGDSYKLTAYTKPDDGSVSKRGVTWEVTSGDSYIKQGSRITTDTGGEFWITAKYKGTTVIEVVAEDGGGASATCTITIVEDTSTETTYEYTLKYNLMGGSGTIPTFSTSYDKSTYTTTVTILEPNKDGYTFKGWDSNPSADTVDFKGGDRITLSSGRATTLYAVWEKIATNWTLSFDLAGGSGTFTTMTEPEAGSTHAWTLPSNAPTREGWVFSGWARNSTASVAAYSPGSAYVAYNQNDTVHAVWIEGSSKNLFIVEFDLCGGNGDFGDMEVEDDDTSHMFTIPSSTPTKAGYDFIGWGSNSGTSTVRWEPGKTYSFGIGTTTLYAVWTQYTFVLTLYDTDESGKSKTVEGIGVGEVSVTIPSDYIPTRTNYTFDGWQTKDKSITYQPGQAIKLTENLNLFGKWVQSSEVKPAVRFNVTSDESQSTTVVLEEAEDGTYRFPVYTPSREGYVFIGWADVDNASASVYTAGDKIDMSTPKTLQVYAVWKIESTTWTVDFDPKNGSGAPNTISMPATSETTKLDFTIPAATLVRSGYTFKGWDNTEDASRIIVYPSGGTFTATKQHETLYAVWEIGEPGDYTVIFDDNGGSGGPGTRKSAGASFDIPDVTPTYAGHVFAGWEWTHEGTTEIIVPGVDPPIMLVDKETVLKAVWKEITADFVFDIVFDLDGGQGIDSTQSVMSSTVPAKFTIPSGYTPTKSGCEFLGWSKNENGEERCQPGGTVDLTSETTILHAVWKSTSLTSPTLNWSLSVNGTTLSFDGSASLNVRSWVWDFGDGSGSSEKSGTHAYGKIGTYTVKLTVYSDSGMSETRTKNIVVNETNETVAEKGIGLYVTVAIVAILIVVVAMRFAGVF